MYFHGVPYQEVLRLAGYRLSLATSVSNPPSTLVVAGDFNVTLPPNVENVTGPIAYARSVPHPDERTARKAVLGLLTVRAGNMFTSYIAMIIKQCRMF